MSARDDVRRGRGGEGDMAAVARLVAAHTANPQGIGWGGAAAKAVAKARGSVLTEMRRSEGGGDDGGGDGRTTMRAAAKARGSVGIEMRRAEGAEEGGGDRTPPRLAATGWRRRLDGDDDSTAATWSDGPIHAPMTAAERAELGRREAAAEAARAAAMLRAELRAEAERAREAATRDGLPIDSSDDDWEEGHEVAERREDATRARGGGGGVAATGDGMPIDSSEATERREEAERREETARARLPRGSVGEEMMRTEIAARAEATAVEDDSEETSSEGEDLMVREINWPERQRQLAIIDAMSKEEKEAYYERGEMSEERRAMIEAAKDEFFRRAERMTSEAASGSSGNPREGLEAEANRMGRQLLQEAASSSSGNPREGLEAEANRMGRQLLQEEARRRRMAPVDEEEEDPFGHRARGMDEQ